MIELKCNECRRVWIAKSIQTSSRVSFGDRTHCPDCNSYSFVGEDNVRGIHIPLPILQNHDPSRVLGRMGDDRIIEFIDPGGYLDNAMPLGLGYRALEQEFRDGIRYLKKIQLLEISLGAHGQGK